MAYGLNVFGLNTYLENLKVLNRWCEEESRLTLVDLKQIYFHDGRDIKEDYSNLNKYAWFIMQLSDGEVMANVEIQIRHDDVLEDNIIDMKTIYEYLKTLMYVDKSEWKDFFECGVIKKKGIFYLICYKC